MATLIRKMWEKADGSVTGPDQFSSQAVDTILATQGTSFPHEFATFVDANRRPTQAYSEGAANQYPTAPLGNFSKKSGWYVTKLDHLTSATGLYKPGKQTSKLKLTVDLGAKASSPAAIVSVYLKSGKVQTSFIPLNAKGNGDKVFPFAKSKVDRVEVTLVNASGRFANCYSYATPFACGGGVPKDENLTAKVKGAVK
jgi:hypothetical protein